MSASYNFLNVQSELTDRTLVYANFYTFSIMVLRIHVNVALSLPLDLQTNKFTIILENVGGF